MDHHFPPRYHTQPKKLVRCTEFNCHQRFVTQRDLQQHLDDKHGVRCLYWTVNVATGDIVDELPIY